ncbi:MAG TPA: hypothetical protein VLH08_17365 [Acidobacteriota bacterium]|nr:hypothetical protein [Acidobacteriota bacterium]
MWNKLVHSPAIFLYLFLGTAISIAIGFWSHNQYLMPLLNVLVPYPVMYKLLAEEKRKRAFATMLFWALCTGVLTTWAVVHFYDQATAAIFHGAAYKQEMFHWIRTGEGAEGNPARFVPQHLIHFVIFCVLSAVSAGFLSLLMGAFLMNYMSYYVGSLIANSSDPFLASMMGWHPWSAVRVASFVLLGVMIAEPTICKIVKRDYNYSEIRPYFWAAITGIALDVVMKALLAPWWGLTLRKILQ